MSPKKRLSSFAADAAADGFIIPNCDFPRKLRDAAYSAKIPAELINGSYHYDPADKGKIAEAMNLKRQQPARAVREFA